MKYVSRILILGLLSTSLACTKATPEFEQLDPNSIPQPKFNGATTKTVITGSTSVAIGLINGECDPKIQDITAMAVNVATGFSGLATVASTSSVTCSADGKFSLNVKSLFDLGFAPLVLGNTYEIQLKGQTTAGPSRASSIFIQYMNALGNPNIRVTGGGIHGGAIRASDGSAYSAEVQVQSITKSTPHAAGIASDGSNYTFRPAGFAR